MPAENPGSRDRRYFRCPNHWRGGHAGYSNGICDDRNSTRMQRADEIDPAVQEKIAQLLPRAWLRVQQRTGRSWDKKRGRWLQLLGADGSDQSSNQLRVALNNL